MDSQFQGLLQHSFEYLNPAEVQLPLEERTRGHACRLLVNEEGVVRVGIHLSLHRARLALLYGLPHPAELPSADQRVAGRPPSISRDEARRRRAGLPHPREKVILLDTSPSFTLSWSISVRINSVAVLLLTILCSNVLAVPAPKLPKLAPPTPPTEQQIADATQEYAKLGGKYVRSMNPWKNQYTHGFTFARQVKLNLKDLPNVPFAFWLSFSGTQITDQDLADLHDLENLHHLELRRTGITDAGLNGLKNLRRLNSLDLSESRLSDAGLKALPALWIITLNVGNTRVTAAGLKELKDLRNLEELYLYGTPVTNEGLEALQECKHLTRLSLTLTKVSDAGLENLKNLKGLSHLDLGSTSITDATMKEVRHLTRLTWLDVSHTHVTDACLKDLVEFKSLKVLRLDGTKVTSEAIKSLKATLPNCRIDYFERKPVAERK